MLKVQFRKQFWLTDNFLYSQHTTNSHVFCNQWANASFTLKILLKNNLGLEFLIDTLIKYVCWIKCSILNSRAMHFLIEHSLYMASHVCEGKINKSNGTKHTFVTAGWFTVYFSHYRTAFPLVLEEFILSISLGIFMLFILSLGPSWKRRPEKGWDKCIQKCIKESKPFVINMLD